MRLSYGHTSHGSQLVTGMDAIKGVYPVYDFNTNGDVTLGVLSLDDYTPEGDLGGSWYALTRAYLNGSGTGTNRNVTVWSWCGQVSSSTLTDINTYLSQMNQLETDYPSVNFVYMTGHLDGSGEAGNLKIRNKQIRDYAIANNKALFDFADIESYDPAGTYYPNESDACSWCSAWCSLHPSDCENLPEPGSCAHSHELNCLRKGQAFWWLLARLAGWPGPNATSVTISGNAGVAGATLSYTDGTAKTATADGSGSYSISVPNGWSGIITPIRTGFPFTPVSRSYSNVQNNQTAQDYTNYWYGSVSITANKNVVAVGRPHIGSEVASYSGFSAGALTAYVPMLFKNAFGGTYDSALYVQNVDSSVTANVTIKYYDSAAGILTCTDTDTIKPLASKGYWLPTLSATECTGGTGSGLPVGWVGSAVVTSSTTAKIVANGRPHIGGEVMTYDSFSSGSLTSYLPMLFNGAWGSYNSAYYVQNVDPLINAEVTIKYYNSETGALTCTDTATIAPNTSKGYWLPTAKCLYSTSTTPALLPAGWVGGVVVTSSAAPIVTVGRPHIGSQITTYNGFAAGGLSSYVPMLFRKAYGGTYDSALYVQNVGAVDAAITIKYYKTDGTLTCTATDTIKSLSSNGYWLPTISAAECTGGTGGGLPDDWVGGAVVTSTSAKIVAIGRPHIGAQVTTYNGFASGSSNSYLPMLFKNMWGYNSAFYIQNTDAAGPASVTVKFYDVEGNLSCTRHDSIPALSTLGYWAPSVICE